MEENKNSPEIQVSDTPEVKSEPVKNEQTTEEKEKTKLSVLDFLKKCFSTDNLKKTIAVILLVVIVVGAIVGITSYNSPKSVALRFVKANCEFDLKVKEKLLAYDNRTLTLNTSGYQDDEEAFFERQSDKYEEDINSWKDYFKVYRKQGLESLDDSLGDYKYTYEVSRIKDISERKVKDENESLLSSLEAEADFDADTIGEGKNAIIKVKLDSEDEGIVRFTVDVTLVKVSNSWKVLDWELY